MKPRAEQPGTREHMVANTPELLGLSTRIRYWLLAEGLTTYAQVRAAFLAGRIDPAGRGSRNFGEKSFQELRSWLGVGVNWLDVEPHKTVLLHRDFGRVVVLWLYREAHQYSCVVVKAADRDAELKITWAGHDPCFPILECRPRLDTHFSITQ